MNCSFYELRHKEVINRKTGARIGFVDDLDIDVECARINALIIYGGCRLFSIFGKRNDYVIPWQKIGVIGDDTILVDWSLPRSCEKRLFGRKCRK